jgi:hypothetical protein
VQENVVNLQTYFEDTVAAGWAPRHPAGESELRGLEESTVRGTCVEPLLYAGDIVYIDRNAKPEPGDLVSFALSARAAEGQNTPPFTADHRTRYKGDRWTKLYGRYHSFDMLFTNATSATATWLACEVPDDVPVLHPVRNVRRNGRLLFGTTDAVPVVSRRAMLLGGIAAPLALASCGDDAMPFNMLPACTEPDDSVASNIGPDAATGTFQLSVAGPDTFNAGTLPPGPAYYGLVSGTPFDPNITAVGAMLTFDCVQSVSGSYAQVYMEANWGTGTQDSDICQVNPVNVGNRFTIQKFFTAIPAGSVWTIRIRLACSGSASFTMTNTLLQVELLKR